MRWQWQPDDKCLFCNSLLILFEDDDRLNKKCTNCNIRFILTNKGYVCWQRFTHLNNEYTAYWYSYCYFKLITFNEDEVIKVIELNFLPQKTSPNNIDKLLNLLAFS